MTRLCIVMVIATILGGCSLFKSAPPPPAPVPERDNTVSNWFQVVSRRADVAAYPSAREHVLTLPSPDRQFVVVRVMNYPKVRALITPTFVPAVPAKQADAAPLKPIATAPRVQEIIVRFPNDASRLTSEGKQKLDQLVTDLGSSLSSSDIRVEGHTDSVGSDAHNDRLSLQRAQSVRDYLVGKGAQATRVTAVGMGERSPAASNETESGRSANRRAVVQSKTPAN